MKARVFFKYLKVQSLMILISIIKYNGRRGSQIILFADLHVLRISGPRYLDGEYNTGKA